MTDTLAWFEEKAKLGLSRFDLLRQKFEAKFDPTECDCDSSGACFWHRPWSKNDVAILFHKIDDK